MKINKINKENGWIGVGICSKQRIKTNNFGLNSWDTSHGSYIITS